MSTAQHAPAAPGALPPPGAAPTADDELRRIEALPDYLRVIRSDYGQALLRRAAREAAEARRKAAQP